MQGSNPTLVNEILHIERPRNFAAPSPPARSAAFGAQRPDRRSTPANPGMVQLAKVADGSGAVPGPNPGRPGRAHWQVLGKGQVGGVLAGARLGVEVLAAEACATQTMLHWIMREG